MLNFATSRIWARFALWYAHCVHILRFNALCWALSENDIGATERKVSAKWPHMCSVRIRLCLHSVCTLNETILYTTECNRAQQSIYKSAIMHNVRSLCAHFSLCCSLLHSVYANIALIFATSTTWARFPLWCTHCVLNFRSIALCWTLHENDNSATERKISAHFARIVRSYLVRKPSRNEAQNECKLRTNRALKLWSFCAHFSLILRSCHFQSERNRGQ